MSVVIGIDYNFESEVADIVFDNKELGNVYLRKNVPANFETLILNLKDEFKENLIHIYLCPRDNVPENMILNNDPFVNFLSKEDLEFTHVLSAKPALGTKILLFDADFISTVKWVLYDFTTPEGNILKTIQTKFIDIRFYEEDIYEMLTEVTGCKLNEIHALMCKPYEKDKHFFEKIIEIKEHFCSFTMIKRKYMENAYKAMIYGRFLLHEVQSLVKLESYRSHNSVNLKEIDLEFKKHFQLPQPINIYSSQTKLMGIDLGTSRCVVSISRNNSAQPVKIDEEYSMPTIISFAEQEPIIGSVAMRHYKKQTKNVLYNFKYLVQRKRREKGYEESRHFGICETAEDISFVVNSNGKRKIYSSLEIYQILLQKLKRAASVYQLDLNQGQSIDQAVITVPRLNDNIMIKNISAAANLAGIRIIDIISEIHADVLYVLSKYDIPPGQSIIVVDIGGGTGFIQKFEITEKDVISQFKFELIMACGRKLDHLLMDELLELFGKRETDINDIQMSKMLIEVERIKETLSFEKTTHVNFPSTITQTENLPQVTRTWFEKEVLEKYFGREKKRLARLINDANSLPEPTKVFLVGGTCRIPYIQNLFETYFEKDKIVVPENIQHITATGALIRGLQILNNEAKPAFHGITMPRKMSDPTVDIKVNETPNSIKFESTVIDDLTAEITGYGLESQIDSSKQKQCLPARLQN